MACVVYFNKGYGVHLLLIITTTVIANSEISVNITGANVVYNISGSHFFMLYAFGEFFGVSMDFDSLNNIITVNTN